MTKTVSGSLWELPFDEESLHDPLKWIERLSPSELLIWLRRALWSKDSLPVTVPSTGKLASHLVDLFANGSAKLRTRLRTVIPELLREWGRNDSSECLDDLLVLCSATRSTSAEPTIILILSERLKGRRDKIPMRQRCLMTLSGFGCTKRTTHIFKRYLVEAPYVAICYRALYRFQLSYAATELRSVIETYRESSALYQLKPVLQLLFFNTLRAPQRSEVWKLFLTLIQAQDLFTLLETLKSVGIFLVPNYQGNEEREEIIVQYEKYETGALQSRDVIRSDELDYQIVSAINYSLEVATTDESWLKDSLREMTAEAGG